MGLPTGFLSVFGSGKHGMDAGNRRVNWNLVWVILARNVGIA